MNSIDIDVGGTFTDSVLTFEGEQTIAKARPLIAGMGDRVEFAPVGGRGLPDQ